jgi:hypothetical protein
VVGTGVSGMAVADADESGVGVVVVVVDDVCLVEERRDLRIVGKDASLRLFPFPFVTRPGDVGLGGIAPLAR